MPMPTLFKWSPQPDHTPDGSPASQSSSRFSALHHNVRSIINGSSIYSQSPTLHGSDRSPKSTFRGFLRRDHSPPAPLDIHTANNPPHSADQDGRPLYPQHTATSYMRAFAPLDQPQQPDAVYRREDDIPDRHPADVQLDLSEGVDPETVVLSDDVQRRRRRRHRRRKHHDGSRSGSGSGASSGASARSQRAWVRRRGEKQRCMPFVRGTAARGKMIACVISGGFLVGVLAIYLTLALTRTSLGQEIHILFIMILLATTIFFSHSLIRLCMLLLRPPPPPAPSQITFNPNMTAPEGFVPERPIRVHLARDEVDDVDLESGYSDDDGRDGARDGGDAEKERDKVPLPPPAYGLWRSSVRVDPNLLHWQKVEDPLPLLENAGLGLRSSAMSASTRGGSAISARTYTGTGTGSRGGSAISAHTAASRGGSAISTHSRAPPREEGPRPPSYASEDGVEYVVEARARSVAPAPTAVQARSSAQAGGMSDGMSDVHPAWRPGYAV